MKKTVLACALVLLACTAPAFDKAEKRAVRTLAEKMEARFRTARALDGLAITILPVRGDAEDYFEGLLLDAAINAGKTCVIGNDVKDARFARILKDIKWDEMQTRLSSVDPATVDELGKLKSTQVFLEATLEVSKEKRHAEAELSVRAYSVATKQYVWSAHEAVSGRGGDGPWWKRICDSAEVNPALLNVKVSATPSNSNSTSFAALVDAALTDAVIRRGYTAEGSRPADIEVAARPMRTVFDRSGGYAVFEGTVQVVVQVMGTERRLIGDRIFSSRGARGLGDLQADKNLAAAATPQLVDWLTKTLSPSAIGFEAVTFKLSLGCPVQEVGDLAAPEAIRRAGASLDGVRSVTLEAQDDAKGVFTYRAVYEKAKFPGGFLNQLLVKHPELEDAFAE